MAKLLKTLPEPEIRHKNVVEIRGLYLDLAECYNQLVNGDLMYCHKCDGFKNPNEFYNDKRYVSGLFPECKECLLNEATDYNPRTKVRTDNKEKTIAVFRKLDIPFYENKYRDFLLKIEQNIGERNKTTAYAQMISYVKSFKQYGSATFKDSIFELDDTINQENETTRKSRKEIKKIFGSGYSEADYLFLQDQYDDFKIRTTVDSKSQEIYVVQICLSLLEIDKDRKLGKDVTAKLKSLDILMNSANLQPKQNVSNVATDSLTFSQLIAKWEQEEPIPEPDPELSDVSGIAKKIRVWFGGWLANAIGLNVPQSEEYLEEVSKYTVTKPTVDENEGNSSIYNQLFGSSE